jgi:hypothetical protein
MTDFIIALFCIVDDHLVGSEKHSQSKLYPSEVVTLALLYSLKGCGQRAFWRWLTRDYQELFPNLPDRTRLFRQFNTHQEYVNCFLADPSILGVIDSYGIELQHPVRDGRSEKQIGKKGRSNHRWIVGGKLCYVLNHLGLIVSWACDTANVYDGSAFQQLVDDLDGQMIIFSDLGFTKKDWKPDNLRLCRKGEWNNRMLVETVLSMLTYICDFKRSRHKVWNYFKTKVGFTMALFNILVQWHGFEPDEDGFVPLSIAEFSL